jgi:hypothetical protein
VYRYDGASHLFVPVSIPAKHSQACTCFAAAVLWGCESHAACRFSNKPAPQTHANSACAHKPQNLFTERYHFNECEKLLQLFKTRYAVERSVPITFMNKLVPNIFNEDPLGAPTDLTPFINQMLRNTGQVSPSNSLARIRYPGSSLCFRQRWRGGE